MTTVIIPSRNEEYLSKTVDDVFSKSTGDVEAIVVIDGPTNYSIPVERAGLTIITNPSPRGMRAAINLAASQARGKFVMKIDAHTALSPNYDRALKDASGDRTAVTLPRYNLYPGHWQRKTHSRIDYFFLSYPWTESTERPRMQSSPWRAKTQSKLNVVTDEQMIIHGSMWFMPLSWFNHMGGLSSQKYGSLDKEAEEISFTTWLGGGRILVHKAGWYAQLHKGELKDPFNYSRSRTETDRADFFSADYWTRNRWADRLHDFDWLIERFWPLPTSDVKYPWPENWKDVYQLALRQGKHSG